MKYTLPVLKLNDMKVKLLKNHVLGKQGDIINVNFFKGKRIISEGVALEQKQTKVEEDEERTDKIDNNGSNTKKRVTRKGKTNAKP